MTVLQAEANMLKHKTEHGQRARVNHIATVRGYRVLHSGHIRRGTDVAGASIVWAMSDSCYERTGRDVQA